MGAFSRTIRSSTRSLICLAPRRSTSPRSLCNRSWKLSSMKQIIQYSFIVIMESIELVVLSALFDMLLVGMLKLFLKNTEDMRPKIRDCDVKYITSYEVSSLQNLFTRPRTSSSITDRDRKILKYFVLAAIVLTIWIGSLCWASHRGLVT